MTTRGLAALVLAAVLATGARADDPKLPDVKAFDRLVVDALRAVHNTGADLYNEGKDFAGAFRVYQGALQTVRPLLGHRPDTQKLIDMGLDAADAMADPARRAFVLHETIEAVRKSLKDATAEPAKKPVEEPKKVTEPPAKKPEEPVEPAEVKPALPVAPPPRAKG